MMRCVLSCSMCSASVQLFSVVPCRIPKSGPFLPPISGSIRRTPWIHRRRRRRTLTFRAVMRNGWRNRSLRLATRTGSMPGGKRTISAILTRATGKGLRMDSGTVSSRHAAC
uniref:Putative secreted protein n=1 Tax=Anopheles marajoara TaxID=58244 RepID=A0A2M4C812_9DIPT